MKFAIMNGIVSARLFKSGAVVAAVCTLAFCAYAGGRASAQNPLTLDAIKSKAKSGKAAKAAASANIGQELRLAGSGFPQNASVQFTAFANSTFLIVPLTVEPRRIVASVPAEVVTGDVRVMTPEGAGSAGRKLQIVPVIQTLNPASVAPGGRLLIDGTGFGPDTKVMFKGVSQPVSPTVVSPVRVDVVVPSGAKSGPVSVATAGGKSKPMKLTVTASQVTR